MAMKSSRILFTCLLLLLDQTKGPYSTICTAGSSAEIFEVIALWKEVYDVIVQFEELDVKSVQQLVSYLQKYPVALSICAVGLSITMLQKSTKDMASVDHFKKEYDTLLKTPRNSFKTPDDYLNYLKERSDDIRARIVKFKEGQKLYGIFNILLSVACAVVGPLLGPIGMPLMQQAVAFSGTAAVFNFYNCHELNKLLDLIEKSGSVV